MKTVSEESVQQSQVCVHYELSTAHIDDWENMSYTTYGIRAVDTAGKTMIFFPDVQTDKGFVQDIVDRCNNGALSPLHLQDVLEDCLGY